jgi:hypothetical protein
MPNYSNQRPSLLEEEGVARLRELGVTGDDSAVTDLLEAANFDVNLAANMFMDRLLGGQPRASVEDTAAGAYLEHGVSMSSNRSVTYMVMEGCFHQQVCLLGSNIDTKYTHL